LNDPYLRSYLFISILFLSFYCNAADTDTAVDIKLDFAAYGDGIHNDHEAFVAASRLINERKGNVTLTIPSGVYLAGRQLDHGVLVPIAYRQFCDGTLTNPYLKMGIPVLFISGCKNVTIKGDAGAVIKFSDDMPFGSFDVEDNPVPLKDRQGNTIVPKQNSIALVGDGIYIENSEGITISNIELDGNSAKLRVGGNITADGWQAGQTGIALVEVSKCKLNGVNVHHFAVDGLQIRNTTPSKMEIVVSQSIELNNSSFNYNGRQGFSWTGGAGLAATSCSFSHTGRVYNHSLKATLSTSPGAGMDIEPEPDPHIGVFRLVKDAVFRKCNFENNSGVGAIADLYGEEGFRVAQDIAFEDCTFWGSTAWSVWVSHPGFTFTNCRIYGSAVHSFTGDKPGMETKFVNCFFEDKPYVNEKGKRIGPYGNYLVEIADGIRTSFDNCIFTAHNKPFYYLVCSRPNDEKAKFRIRNCKFLNASGSSKVKNTIAEGVIFSGKNDHIDIPPAK
jgi:hypothetical protein